MTADSGNRLTRPTAARYTARVHRGLRIAVVVPAFNEERAIGRTLSSLPDFVDHVVVVDDASRDATAARAAACSRRGLLLLRHPVNRGVGAAIATGYHEALRLGVDVAVVMAGDGQMDPADLPGLLAPIAEGRADYVKGNRFLRREVWRVMPWTRLSGNLLLSLATKAATGYWRLFDSQCGFTAASRAALRAIRPEELFPRYGYPNDVLGRLARAGARVVDVPVRPVYGPGWRSGIRLRTVLYPITFLLARIFVRRWLSPSPRALLSPSATPARDG